MSVEQTPLAANTDPRDFLSKRLHFEDLDPVYLRNLVEFALQEDLYFGGLNAKAPYSEDVTTSALRFKGLAKAHCIAGQSAVVCGLPLLAFIAKRYELTFETELCEGANVTEGMLVGSFSGNPAKLLELERFLMNFLLRLSGLASHVRQFVEALEGRAPRLLDTRKTTPGWRALEKYAVGVGGAWNHRYGLSDRVMFKDNHFAARGIHNAATLEQCVKAARSKYPKVPIEIEVDALEMLEWALPAEPDVILLDNFSVAQLKEAVQLREAMKSSVFLEGSGMINVELVGMLKDIGLDFISIGAMIHQATWVHMSLDWET